jgi:PPM family protein phosphatase
MAVTLDSHALAHAGRMRKRNEDTVFQKIVAPPDTDAVGLFIVADGVGGRLAGMAASYWAVETIKNQLADLIDHRDPRATNRFSQETIRDLQSAVASGMDPANTSQRVRAAISKANDVVREYSRNRPEEARNAGSTVCVALIQGLYATIANVGDSRGYVLRQGRLRQITKDHSLVQRMIDLGQLKPEERYTHPQRNLIFRSLGAAGDVEADLFPLRLEPGDHLLLCSDGLWEMIRDPAQITALIQGSSTLENACQALLAAANDAGGEDNIGVVLVRVAP